MTNIEQLKEKIKQYQENHSFSLEKKTIGRKEFETYLINGINYIRVTSPLSYFVPPALKAWLQTNTKEHAQKTLIDAGTLGTEIHKIIEECKGDVSKLPEHIEDEKIRNGVEAFKNFWNEQKLTVVAQEIRLHSNTYGIAGSIDKVAMDEKGVPVIIDWKSSNSYRATYGWQIAAYGILFKEHFEIKPRLMAVMLDKKTGKATKIEYEHNDYLEACYLGILQAFAGENWKALGEFWKWNLTIFSKENK